jgi:hypothetical protein
VAAAAASTEEVSVDEVMNPHPVLLQQSMSVK